MVSSELEMREGLEDWKVGWGRRDVEGWREVGVEMEIDVGC